MSISVRSSSLNSETVSLESVVIQQARSTDNTAEESGGDFGRQGSPSGSTTHRLQGRASPRSNEEHPNVDPSQFLTEPKDIRDTAGASYFSESSADFSCKESRNTYTKWHSGDSSPHIIPKKGDPWEESFKMVQKFDDEMCRGWRDEIDTLLVFAGLFSAAVTAFTIESYHSLQEDPSIISMQLLAQISSQLNQMTSGSLAGSSNFTTTAFSPNAFQPTVSAVRVNIFWFTSLTLALITALIGILAKQWLREYQRYEGLSPKEAFSVRQMRYEGLLGWHVPKILYSLPLLLQAALVLFFAGLIDLLMTINLLVASVISVLVGLAMIFLLTTTALPSLQHFAHFSKLLPAHEPRRQCAYKSPQSWVFHLLGTWIASLSGHVRLYIFGATAGNYLDLSSWYSDANWVKYDVRWQARGKYIERGISWFDKTFSRNTDAVFHVYHCLETLDPGVASCCVSQIIEETWSPLLPLANMIIPALKSFQDQALVEDEMVSVGKELVLTGYLVTHHRADTILSMRCVELCSRLLKASAEDFHIPSIALEALNVVIPSAPISEDLFMQLLGSLASLFAHDRISSADLPIFWSIFHALQKYSSFESEDIPARPAYRLLRYVEHWLLQQHGSGLSSEEQSRRILKCCRGLSSVYAPLKTGLDGGESVKFPEFVELESLLRTLDNLLETRGGIYGVISPRGDSWITSGKLGKLT